MTIVRGDNPFEAEARAMKVRSLLNALEAAYILAVGRTVGAETMLEAVTTFTESQWLTLDRLARVKRPASAATRLAAIAELRLRVEAVSTVRLASEQYERECDDEGVRLAGKKGWEL